MRTNVPATGQARGTQDDLDDGAVEELLFGWFEGKDKEGEKQRSSRCPQYSLPPSIYLNQLSLSRDIIYPIIIDQINIFTRIFHKVTLATVSDSLGTRTVC